MPLTAGVGFAGENSLHAVKEDLANERFMHAREGLTRLLKVDEAEIEGIVEQRGESIAGHPSPAAVAESPPMQFRAQGFQIEVGAGIKLERLPDDRSHHGVNRLGLSPALIDIAERSLQRVEALLQTSVKSLAGLLTQIADVIGGHDRLNVGRKSATPGLEIQPFGNEVNLNALIRKLADSRPIPEVARSPVQLMQDDSPGASATKQFECAVEHGTTLLGRGFHLLQPDANRQSIAFGVTQNRLALFLQRDSLGSLFHRGDTDVADVSVHGCGRGRGSGAESGNEHCITSGSGDNGSGDGAASASRRSNIRSMSAR
jgi:hypothetical protein